jgi:hypothetical protein
MSGNLSKLSAVMQRRDSIIANNKRDGEIGNRGVVIRAEASFYLRCNKWDEKCEF